MEFVKGNKRSAVSIQHLVGTCGRGKETPSQKFGLRTTSSWAEIGKCAPVLLSASLRCTASLRQQGNRITALLSKRLRAGLRTFAHFAGWLPKSSCQRLIDFPHCRRKHARDKGGALGCLSVDGFIQQTPERDFDSCSMTQIMVFVKYFVI